MKITNVRVKLFENGNFKGFADAEIDESLVLTGIKIVENKSKGLFIGMPAMLGKDNEYHDLYYPCTKEFREILTDAVLDAYEAAMDDAQKQTPKGRRRS